MSITAQLWTTCLMSEWPAEVRPAEVRPAEVRPAEVRPAEVWPAEVPSEPA